MIIKKPDHQIPQNPPPHSISLKARSKRRRLSTPILAPDGSVFDFAGVGGLKDQGAAQRPEAFPYKEDPGSEHAVGGKKRIGGTANFSWRQRRQRQSAVRAPKPRARPPTGAEQMFATIAAAPACQHHETNRSNGDPGRHCSGGAK